jgi:hypothetical protein
MNNTCKKTANMGTTDKRFQSTSLFTNMSPVMQAETSESTVRVLETTNTDMKSPDYIPAY